jgi:isocitrate dehydrogenase (NAD+)
VSVRIRKTLDLYANLRPIKILSGVLLKYIGENREAKMVGQAISSVLSKGKALTIDMGGNATTTDIRDAIISEIKAKNH